MLNYQEGNVSIFCLSYRIRMWKRVSISFYCTACCMHCICLIVVWSKIDVVLLETSSDSLSRQMMTSHLPAFLPVRLTHRASKHTTVTPGHSAHHWPGVRQMVQCLLRSALCAWSLGLRSWELGANPLRMLSGWQWHDALMCPLGSKERDEGKPSRFASPWSTLAIRRGGLLRYPGSWAESAQFCTANQIPSDNLMQLSLGIPVAHYSLHGQCRTWGATFSMSALRTDVH